MEEFALIKLRVNLNRVNLGIALISDLKVHCQCTCDSWIFSLFLTNFFPIFPFICQFQRLNTISCKSMKNFRLFAPFARLHGDFHRWWREKTGKKLTFLILEREEAFAPKNLLELSMQ